MRIGGAGTRFPEAAVQALLDMGFSRGQSQAALLRADGVVELAANLLASRTVEGSPPSPRLALLGSQGGPTVVGSSRPVGLAKLRTPERQHCDTITATPAQAAPAGTAAAASGGSAAGNWARRNQVRVHPLADSPPPGSRGGVLSPSAEHEGASSTDISDGESVAETPLPGGSSKLSTADSAMPSSMLNAAPPLRSSSTPGLPLQDAPAPHDTGAAAGSSTGEDRFVYTTVRRTRDGAAEDGGVYGDQAGLSVTSASAYNDDDIWGANQMGESAPARHEITPQAGLLLAEQGHSAARLFFANEDSASVSSQQ